MMQYFRFLNKWEKISCCKEKQAPDSIPKWSIKLLSHLACLAFVKKYYTQKTPGLIRRRYFLRSKAEQLVAFPFPIMVLGLLKEISLQGLLLNISLKTCKSL